MKKLNKNELEIIQAIKDNSEDITGDPNEYAHSDELRDYCDFTDNEIKGYLGDLKKKKVLEIHLINNTCSQIILTENMP